MAHRTPRINDTVIFTDQQQAILNDAVEQLMEAGGLTALTQAHFNEAMKACCWSVNFTVSFILGVRCATVIPFAPYGSAIIAWTQKTLHPPILMYVNSFLTYVNKCSD